MLAPNTNTRARCTGDDESAPKTRDSTRRRCTARSRRHVNRRALLTYLLELALTYCSRNTSGSAVDRRSDKTRQEHLRCFGAPACRVFPDVTLSRDPVRSNPPHSQPREPYHTRHYQSYVTRKPHRSNTPPHSQPRALRHTLLTNIMSLWIRAPRN